MIGREFQKSPDVRVMLYGPSWGDNVRRLEAVQGFDPAEESAEDDQEEEGDGEEEWEDDEEEWKEGEGEEGEPALPEASIEGSPRAESPGSSYSTASSAGPSRLDQRYSGESLAQRVRCEEYRRVSGSFHKLLNEYLDPKITAERMAFIEPFIEGFKKERIALMESLSETSGLEATVTSLRQQLEVGFVRE